MYNLLIVDDEPTILKGMREKINWYAYGFTKIATETNGEGVLSTALQLRPSLCLMDVCIGHEKGYEIIEKLNGIGVKSNYVMMSGYEDFTYAQKAMSKGALDYLLKPVEAETLQKVVERVILERLNGTLPGKAENGTDPILCRKYSDYSPLMQRIFIYVRTEYHTNLSLKLLSEELHMNTAYLGRLFLAETALHFSEYLMAFRLVRAKEMLLTTDEKIASVAGSAGFNDMSYFYRHFKLYFGQSPTDFRDR
jgi:YesN/AraC family two-component response regulator